MKQTPKFHNTKRREVVASADVEIKQVQVIDKKGEIRTLVVWKCGPDTLYSDTMDGLFDGTRRKRAPEWVTTQLESLPNIKKLDSNGVPYGVESTVATSHIPSNDVDEDLPEFVQG